MTYLLKAGYQLLARNWRWKHLEVDIIVYTGNILVFVEVKTRKSTSFGRPETFVDLQKQGHLIRAAETYIHLFNWRGEVRFDIISIIWNKEIKLRHIKDAFWAF